MTYRKFTYKGITHVEDDANAGIPVVDVSGQGGDVILDSLKIIADRTGQFIVEESSSYDHAVDVASGCINILGNVYSYSGIPTAVSGLSGSQSYKVWAYDNYGSVGIGVSASGGWPVNDRFCPLATVTVTSGSITKIKDERPYLHSEPKAQDRLISSYALRPNQYSSVQVFDRYDTGSNADITPVGTVAVGSLDLRGAGDIGPNRLGITGNNRYVATNKTSSTYSQSNILAPSGLPGASGSLEDYHWIFSYEILSSGTPEFLSTVRLMMLNVPTSENKTWFTSLGSQKMFKGAGRNIVAGAVNGFSNINGGQFDAHDLKYIRTYAYLDSQDGDNTISLAHDSLWFAPKPDNCLLTLRFDDADGVFYNAAEELYKRGLKGTFYVNTNNIGVGDSLTVDQIDQMVEWEHDIQIYGASFSSKTLQEKIDYVGENQEYIRKYGWSNARHLVIGGSSDTYNFWDSETESALLGIYIDSYSSSWVTGSVYNPKFLPCSFLFSSSLTDALLETMQYYMYVWNKNRERMAILFHSNVLGTYEAGSSSWNLFFRLLDESIAGTIGGTIQGSGVYDGQYAEAGKLKVVTARESFNESLKYVQKPR